MSSAKAFHQIGGRAEKALAVVEDSWMPLNQGISNMFLLLEYKALRGDMSGEMVLQV